jgi:hypothetical protein
MEVFEVDSAAAEMMVDLARHHSRGVGPKLQSSLLDPRENLVELRLGREKREMTRGDPLARVDEVQAHTVARLYCDERAEGTWRRQTKNLGEELRRGTTVASVPNRVIELYGHDAASSFRIISPNHSAAINVQQLKDIGALELGVNTPYAPRLTRTLCALRPTPCALRLARYTLRLTPSAPSLDIVCISDRRASRTTLS